MASPMPWVEPVTRAVRPVRSRLLESARPGHDRALEQALADAATRPELAPLVAALHALDATP